MVTRARKDAAPVEIQIAQLQNSECTVLLRGRTPLICNRLTEKAAHELLLPPRRKNTAERQQSLKHDPLAEFAAAAHTIQDDRAPTLLAIPSTALKGAMRDAALDLPGATKAQIGRLTFIEGALLPVYGIPQLLMSIVRMADANRTPDVRSRVIVPEWALMAPITFVTPQLSAPGIVNLLHAAGQLAGLGDWRQQKGSGSFGLFEVVNADDAAFQRIVKTGGRKAQLAAMKKPVAYDADTEELLGWFDAEMRRRGLRAA